MWRQIAYHISDTHSTQVHGMMLIQLPFIDRSTANIIQCLDLKGEFLFFMTCSFYYDQKITCNRRSASKIIYIFFIHL